MYLDPDAPSSQPILIDNGNNSPFLEEGDHKPNNKKGLSLVMGTLHRTAQSISGKKNVQECSKFSTGKEVTIRQAIGGGKARFHGLNRCLNTTSCPRCASMLGVKRAKIIDGVSIPIMQAGGTGFMLTATIPHTRKDKFRDLRAGINKCWDRLMRQKFGKAIGSFNQDGRPLWCRAFDYTWGRNGDHLHFHALILCDKTVSQEEHQDLEAMFYNCWIKIVKKYLNKDSQPEALKFDRVYDCEGVSKYNNKISSVAFEIACNATTKRASNGSYNVWELLWAYNKYKNTKRGEVLRAKFRQYERDTHNLRTITFSRKFKELINEENLDEYSEEDANQDSEEVMKIRTDLWKLIKKRNDEPKILELVNSRGQGDKEADNLFDALEMIAWKYNIENDFYNEDEMEMDWAMFSGNLDHWVRKNYPREFYQDYKPIQVQGWNEIQSLISS
jgi:hypothetical protein